MSISNSGNAALTVSNISSDNANVTVSPQSTTVQPGSSTSIAVQWNGTVFFTQAIYSGQVCVTANHTNPAYFPCRVYVISK